MGDPAGIGAEVILKVLSKSRMRSLAHFLIIGDKDVLRKTAMTLSQRYSLFLSRLPFSAAQSSSPYTYRTPSQKKKAKLPYAYILDMHNVKIDTFSFGKVRAEYGKASIEYLTKAVEIIKGGCADCMVTAPINKAAVKRGGFAFPGHTEFLANISGAEKFIMMLCGGPLKISLVTRHIPLRKVAERLSVSAITDTIALMRQALISDFKIRHPKICVCGLNPHAGDNGVIGDEEAKIVAPAIKRFSSSAVIGPLPADAVFYDAYRKKYDGIVCLYHDQGLIPLKMVARDTGVNITVGLPFVRTSPDHGTAFDIAGKGVADSRSMEKAIELAVAMVINRRRRKRNSK